MQINKNQESYSKALFLTIAIFFFFWFSAAANILLIPLVKEEGSKVVSSINTLLSYQLENKKLLTKIKKLQDEKSVLIKWIRFLY